MLQILPKRCGQKRTSAADSKQHTSMIVPGESVATIINGDGNNNSATLQNLLNVAEEDKEYTSQCDVSCS